MEEAARKLGPYTLISKIGRGAFGVVWLAEKKSSIATTRFALKLPRDEDIDLEAFKQEATIWLQASGHPNVVPLIEADIYDQQVVIVSEYIPDGSLAAWLKQHGGRAPSIESACEIIDGVLAGLGHLHERHIIHRDLKPENILLQRETPRLADFGIARLLKTGSYSTNVSGTFAYMAPEAFDGKRNEQTDVWSAGVIFYQLLSGRLPYDQPDTVSLVGAIMRYDPPPLPESVPEVVSCVAIKALQRDPVNRYATVAEMRRDLREAEHRLWLGGQKTGIERPVPIPEPTSARTLQPTVPYTPPAETQPFVPAPTMKLPAVNVSRDIPSKKTSRSLLWLAGAAAVVLLLGALSLAGIYYWISSRAATTAKRSQGQYQLKQTLTGHSGSVYLAVFSPDGKTLASGSYDNTVKLWQVQTGALMQTLSGHSQGVPAIAFSPDGKTLASGSRDTTVKLWDTQTWMLRQTLTGNAYEVWSVAFSPDGKTLASGGLGATLMLWDSQTGILKQTLTGHRYEVRSVAFSPDGKTIASGSWDDTVKLWDVQTAELKQTLTGQSDDINSVSFSPDGKMLAAGSFDKTIRLWDVQTGALKRSLTGHSSQVFSVTFSPDGKTLASGSEDKTVKLWDVQTGALKQTLTGHTNGVYSVAFSPDGKMLASGSSDNTIKLWQVE